jgi:hypothetical protein
MFPLVSFPFLLVYSANPRLILARKVELIIVHPEESWSAEGKRGQMVPIERKVRRPCLRKRLK